MVYVNTNINSQVSQSNLFSVGKDVSQAMERLSSGLKINGAKDNAAGLAISERMTSQVRGMEQAFANAQDGISLAQNAEGALGTITDMLQRMRELGVQAANETYSGTDLSTINDEMTQLSEEISHIANTSTFNGKNLLNAASTFDLQISDKSGDKLTINTIDATAETLLVDAASIDVTTDADAAIDAIDAAIQTVNEARADLGAKQNRLGFISDNLQTSINNTSESRSRIQDADMAKEMSNLTKGEILQQTTMAMLSRANSQPQAVTQLLQG